MTEVVRKVHDEVRDLMLRSIKRPGADKLIASLDNIGFFKAPASSKYHCSFAGGLAVHSLNVYLRLKEICKVSPKIDSDGKDESLVVMALLHDVCKCLFYKVDFRWSKDSGRWEQVRMWTIDDEIPLGHGEKSVYMIQQFMRLTVEEACAIRFHMGYFDESAHVYALKQSITAAYDKYPLAMALHLADLSTGLYEKEMEFNFGNIWYTVPEEMRFLVD